MQKSTGRAILKKDSRLFLSMTEIGGSLTLYFNHYPIVFLYLFSGRKFIQVSSAQNVEILVWKERRVHAFLGK
jgi:hypothetical protein